MNEGKIFEKCFKDSIPKDVYFMRLKDVFAGFGNTNRQSFTSNNPCDSIMYSYPRLFLLEFKSSKGTSFSFSNKIIKEHQIEDLQKASTYKGVISGFIFNYRKYPVTYFVEINKFIKFKNECNKKSINKDDCEKIGVLIEQRLKKVNYTYNIRKFIKDIEEGD